MVSDWLVYSHVLTGKLDILQCCILDDIVHIDIRTQFSAYVRVLANAWIQSEYEPPPSLSLPSSIGKGREREGEGIDRSSICFERVSNHITA